MKTIAIIGGGAAGMMAAATLLESKTEDLGIHLFEKNTTLGVKVKISGGGRCNVTTGIHDPQVLLSKYIRGGKFLRPSLAAFPPQSVRRWFEDHGVPLKEEADRRVFPVSDRGEDVVGVFERLFRDPRMTVHFSEGITAIVHDGQKFQLTSSKDVYSCDTLVLTTGGNAYSRTGSTGDGYAFARALGHELTELGPSLNSFITATPWCRELSGISFPLAKLTSKVNGSPVSVSGPVLFTHFGLSGPAVFALAAHLAFETISMDEQVTIRFSPDASLEFAKFDAQLRGLLERSGARQLHNVLHQFFPERFVVKLLELAELTGKKAAEVSKVERQKLVRLLTGELEIKVNARRPGDEFVTAGGIKLDQVNPKTMESKTLPGLYFAGEILDIDGLTGGFNLQSAWATGRMAGLSSRA